MFLLILAYFPRGLPEHLVSTLHLQKFDRVWTSFLTGISTVLWRFLFFFLFCDCTRSMWKFQSQGLNLCHSDLSHSSDSAGTLPLELQRNSGKFLDVLYPLLSPAKSASYTKCSDVAESVNHQDFGACAPGREGLLLGTALGKNSVH